MLGVPHRPGQLAVSIDPNRRNRTRACKHKPGIDYNQFNCHVFCRGTRNKKQIASHSCWPANTMWRKLLYSGFETCFGPSTQGAGIRYQNTSQIQILLASHFEKKVKWVKKVRPHCSFVLYCYDPLKKKSGGGGGGDLSLTGCTPLLQPQPPRPPRRCPWLPRPWLPCPPPRRCPWLPQPAPRRCACARPVDIEIIFNFANAGQSISNKN